MGSLVIDQLCSFNSAQNSTLELPIVYRNTDLLLEEESLSEDFYQTALETNFLLEVSEKLELAYHTLINKTQER